MKSSQNSNNQSVGKELIPHILELMQFFESKGYDIKPYPKLVISKDASFVNDIFGKTGWYDPEIQSITLITEGRHKKDILRSFSHELFHHAQNINGKLNTESLKNLSDPEYAKNDKHLRMIEGEAFLWGNILMREWSDSKKSQQ